MCSNDNCLAFSLDPLVRPSIFKSLLKVLSSIEDLTNESKLEARQLELRTFLPFSSLEK